MAGYSVGVRWNSKRLEAKLSNALAVASSGQIQAEYERELQPIANDISSKIRASGRGGEHNAEFAKQDIKVFRALSGRYNIQFGWLNTSAHAKERGSGGRLWYQYQDSGFQLFGGPNYQAGVMAAIDRRERVIDAIENVNQRYVRDIAQILER